MAYQYGCRPNRDPTRWGGAGAPSQVFCAAKPWRRGNSRGSVKIYAQNCIWVTSKRGSMTSACFIYSSGRMKKNNVRNNIKNFRNNVIVLSELCQTKFDIVPNFTRARGQKLSGTSASLLIDSCARTSAS